MGDVLDLPALGYYPAGSQFSDDSSIELRMWQPCNGLPPGDAYFYFETLSRSSVENSISPGVTGAVCLLSALISFPFT